MSTLDPKTTHDELTEHRYYPYRGCAPDPDDPKLAAGSVVDPDDLEAVGMRLPVDAWQAPDLEGGEDQNDRRAREAAAIEVCVSCPVMVQCLAYGSSVTADGKLAEPYAILGGMTALDRHKAFIATRHEVTAPAPDRQLRTPQKLAVLRALACHTDPYEVAAAAGMDVRTANWQRSILVTKLNLHREATRGELLAEAARRGLLDAGVVVEDDGSVPAVPPPTRMPDAPSPASVALFASAQAAIPALAPAAARVTTVSAASDGLGGEDATPRPVRVRAPRRDRFTDIAGQLSLDDLAPAGATVSVLSIHSVPLEAAA